MAKKSLYNNFASKADLVTAYLNARHEEWMGLYRLRLERAAGARERVLAVFDAYADHADLAYEHGFQGLRPAQCRRRAACRGCRESGGPAPQGGG